MRELTVKMGMNSRQKIPAKQKSKGFAARAAEKRSPGVVLTCLINRNLERDSLTTKNRARRLWDLYGTLGYCDNCETVRISVCARLYLPSGETSYTENARRQTKEIFIEARWKEQES